MSIRRRGSSWEVTTKFKDLPRIRKSFPTVDEAIAYDARMEERLHLGLGPEPTADTPPPPDVPTTLKELFAITSERYWKGSKSEPSTVTAISVVLQAMGDAPLSSINNLWVETLVNRLHTRTGTRGSNLTGSTINRKLAVVSKALRYGHRMGWVLRVPVIERLKENRHRLRFLSASEESEFLDVCRFLGDTEMSDLFVFLLHTGMRLSEALNCKPEQCNVQTASIHLWEGTTKNDLGRTIPMTNRVSEIVQNRLSYSMLFPGLSRNSAHHRFTKAKRLTSMRADPLVVIHTLRHTFASRLVQAGVDIPTIAQLLGHRSTQMTMRYAHLAPENLRKAVAVLEVGNLRKPGLLVSPGSVGTVRGTSAFVGKSSFSLGNNQFNLHEEK